MPRLLEETHDAELVRAINAARYAQPRGGSRTGRKPYGFVTYLYRNKYEVRAYRPRKLYANMAGHNAKFTHITRFGWRAYDLDGRLRLTCVRFLCGAHTYHATIADQPNAPVCPRCRVALAGYDAAVRALDALAPN